ncbi:MAG: UPF0104 family protein, partial [Methanocalculus sp. MSAO_Arc2]|uniref:lysylphosphatidylglycerol synthase transmembrane domain-containing protein n=1 Tax=Methanocalculus sp. MSAO_Arc2 TaxID=2293855 RepID=UPI000FF22CC4
MQQNTLIKVSAGIITIVLVAILLSQVSVLDVITTILSIHPWYLIAGFFLYTCTYILRTLRIHLLLDGSVRRRDLLPITCIHVMMNNILPARTGELSYVYLLKKLHARTTGEGVATLVVARIFDLIVIILILFGAGLYIRDIPAAISDLLWVVYLLLFCLVIFMVALVSTGRYSMRLVKRAFGFLRWDTTTPGTYILTKGDEAVESFERIGAQRDAVSIGMLSLVLWLSNFGALYLIVAGMGISLSVPNIIFGAAFVLLLLVLPVHGIA